MPKTYKAPKPATIRKARRAVGITQAQAADLIYRSSRAWRYYETGERTMDRPTWELWQQKAARLPKGVRS